MFVVLIFKIFIVSLDNLRIIHFFFSLFLMQNGNILWFYL